MDPNYAGYAMKRVMGRPKTSIVPGEDRDMPRNMVPKSLAWCKEKWRVCLPLKDNLRVYLGSTNFTHPRTGNKWVAVSDLERALNEFKQEQYAYIIVFHKKWTIDQKVQWVDHKRRVKRFKQQMRLRGWSASECRYPGGY